MEKKLLVIILLFGLILRLLGLLNISLTGDFAIHWQKALEILETKRNFLLGPNASVNPRLYLGPFYYYLLIIFYIIGAGNYQSAIIFFSIINTISIYLLYLIVRKYLSQKICLEIILLFSVNKFIIESQNFPWNPHLLIFLNLLTIYSILKIKEGRAIYQILFFLLLGLLLQSHGTAILLFPFYFIMIPLKQIKPVYLLTGVILMFLILSPWFIANFRCQNCQIEEFVRIFTTNKKESCNLIYWLNNHGHGETCFHFLRNPLFILRTFSQSLFQTKNYLGLLFSLFLICWFLFRGKTKNKKLLTLWLVIPFMLFLFYSHNVYSHYFLIFLPLPIIYYIIFLNYIRNTNKHGRIISLVLFSTSLLINIISYVISLGSMRY